MKKVIYLVFSLLCINSYSQTLDTYHDNCTSDSLISRSENISKILFELINEYRDEKGLSQLTIDPDGNLPCELHNKYIYENNCKGNSHHENNKKNSFYRGSHSWDRYQKAKTEIIVRVNFEAFQYNQNPWLQRTDRDIAICLLNVWKRSPSHNGAILTPEFNYISGSANLFLIHRVTASKYLPNGYNFTYLATYTFYK